MAESASVAKLSPRHENIIAWLIANPQMKKADVARAFGVTPAWLSTVIHSDVFQAKLAERQDEYFGSVTQPIREKLENLAGLALDELEEKVQCVGEVSEVREIAKLALTNLGYGGNSRAQGPAVVLQQNNYSVSRETLAASRERILNRSAGEALEQSATSALPAPEEFQTGDSRAVGEVIENASSVRAAAEAPGPTQGGTDL